MDMTTETLVRLYLADGTDTVADALIAAKVSSVSARVEKELDRGVEEKSRTKVFDVDRGATSFQLPAWPVSSVTAVYHDIGRTFDATTLIDPSAYYVSDEGRIVLDTILSEGKQSLKVVWVGGMSTDVDAFVAAFPDIADAVAQQAAHEVRRRQNLSTDTINIPGGGSVAVQAQVGWLSLVLDVLDLYRRPQL